MNNNKIENKKRYAVAFYNNKERMENPEWMKNPQNRLVAYIYDEQEMFDIKYKRSDKEGNRTWFIIAPEELNKAKECFSHEETTEVIDWIDTCNDYNKWKTSCLYCDSININAIPYTYREFGGCIGREYNCLMCSGLTNRTAYEVSEKYSNNGVESAIDFLVAIHEGEYKDEDEKYYCNCCEVDLRKVGLVENGEYVVYKNHEGKAVKISLEEYNKKEEQMEKEIEGYYPNYYCITHLNHKNDMSGYTCFECATKIDDELAKEIVGA